MNIETHKLHIAHTALGALLTTEQPQARYRLSIAFAGSTPVLAGPLRVARPALAISHSREIAEAIHDAGVREFTVEVVDTAVDVDASNAKIFDFKQTVRPLPIVA